MAGAVEPTVAHLEERLRSTRLPDDPTRVVMPPGSDAWPEEFLGRLRASLRPAGILVPLMQRRDGLTVLLTRRSAALRHHAGQISFPGGSMERADADIEATALRETREEVGIAPESVRVLGYLDAMPTVTGYAMTPVVGCIPDGTEVVVDNAEVEYAFEVPLAFLLDPANALPAIREIGGSSIPIVEFLYEDHRIWGATAHVLVQLRDKIIKN
jgi:8-oxo-dGTP pyrophosphatase MutT (NUDIX family)